MLIQLVVIRLTASEARREQEIQVMYPLSILNSLFLEVHKCELVSIRVNQCSCSTAPMLIFWFCNEFDTLFLELLIGFINIVDEEKDF